MNFDMARKKKKTIKKKYDLVDPKTKKVVGELNHGDKILRDTTQQLLSETTMLNAKEDFIKVFVKPLVKLSTMLTNKEAWVATYLLQYLDYTSGVLKHNSGRAITLDDLMDIMEMQPSQTYSVIKKLSDKGIIGKCKIEEQIYFVMNPYIFMKGKRVANTLVDLFKNTQWSSIFADENVQITKYEGDDTVNEIQ